MRSQPFGRKAITLTDAVLTLSALEQVCLKTSNGVTLQSMLWHGAKKRIVDPFNGQDACKNLLLAAVGDPRQRFREDALRILRALRFAAVLGFAIDPDTYQAMLDVRERLSLISRERIASELNRLLLGGWAVETLRTYPRIFFSVFPKLEPNAALPPALKVPHLRRLGTYAAVHWIYAQRPCAALGGICFTTAANPPASPLITMAQHISGASAYQRRSGDSLYGRAKQPAQAHGVCPHSGDAPRRAHWTRQSTAMACYAGLGSFQAVNAPSAGRPDGPCALCQAKC